MSGPWWVAFGLIGAAVIFGLGYQQQECEEDGGTLVRGVFWFSCVEKGTP